MAKISFQHVDKIYPGNVEVIRDLNLTIEDREFVVFVGPSGCGKSTTLRMIAGLEDVTHGELWIGDQQVNDVPAKDRDIAMVFQNYALYPHMTVYKNMAFGLELRKVPKAEIDRKVREAAALLDLTPYLDRKPKALSGGQRQRVALGRAMVRNPAVFLLDEPLSNLDAKLRTSMRAEIIKLHQRLQTTFVYVTHDQTEAMTMGDRICVLNAGKIQQFDTPQTLFDEPANLFVAGFIGSPQMNFLPATLVQMEGGWALQSPAAARSLDLTPELVDTLRADSRRQNRDVVLGIRPEHFELAADRSQADFVAKVDLVERLGSEVYLYLHSGEEEGTQKWIVRVPSQAEVEPGREVGLVWDRKRLHLFDRETEERL